MAKVSDRLKASLVILRRALGVPDVRTDGARIYVMGAPQTLERTLSSRGRNLARFLHAAAPKEDRWTLRSYVDNANHWDGWESAIQFGLDHLGVQRAYEMEVIPVPAKTLPRKTWSAKARKWIKAAPKSKFRFCDQPPVPFGHATGPVLLEVADALPPLMLTHGISMAKWGDMKRCGGLLWPSWALSWRMPSKYGDVVFFASATAVTDIVRPSGKPDRRMMLAGTDIWSPDARELARMEKAIDHELAGDSKWWAGRRERDDGGWGQRGLQNDLLSSGLRADDLVGSWAAGPEGKWEMTAALDTRRKLVRRMKVILEAYTPDPSDPYIYPERDPERWMGEAPYPYAELKVMGKVALGDLPLVVYPKRRKKRVEKTLDALGFQGFRMPLDWKGPLYDETVKMPSEEGEAARRAYARLVTLSVLAWAQNPCHTRGVKVPELITRPDSWRSGYEAVDWWIVGKRDTWQPGFCGGKDPGSRTKQLSVAMQEFVTQKQAYPARYGLERASAIAELDEDVDPGGEMRRYFHRATTARFRLSQADARIGNQLGWFAGTVEPGEEVLVIRTDTPFEADTNPAKLRGDLLG